MQLIICTNYYYIQYIKIKLVTKVILGTGG